MADKKSRGWLTVLYPESCRPDWWDYLAEQGAMCVRSPLHDADINADGETKKEHWHVLLYSEGPKSYKCAKELVDSIGGVGCIAMASLRGSCRYFCHMDNPEKHQYSPDDVATLGGLDYADIVASAADDDLVLYEIMDWLDATGILSFRQLIRYCRTHRTDWARVILHSHRENILAYLRSAQWEQDCADSGKIVLNADEVLIL